MVAGSHGYGRSVSLAYPAAPRGRLFNFLDAVLVIWVAGWIVYGFAVHRQIQDMASLSDTLVKTGQAVDATGRALKPLASLPFGLGKRISGLVDQVHGVALSAEASGEDSRGSIHRLAVELGFAIALIPTVPLVAIYLPLRVSRVREVRAVRRGLRRSRDDSTFREFLARRATEKLPYHVLSRVTANPWRDLENGRYDELAKAELRRLGFRRVDSLGDAAARNAEAAGTRGP
jgi:hypothetical protein